MTCGSVRERADKRKAWVVFEEGRQNGDGLAIFSSGRTKRGGGESSGPKKRYYEPEPGISGVSNIRIEMECS